MSGIGSHQSANSVSDERLTPPEIIRSLGQFDLDPCAPVVRPWDMANKHYTIEDNSLMLPWEGRVWLNPPYGRKMGAFLERMAMHMNGITLIFARTETQDFHKYIWPVADSILFLEGRLTFYDVHGNLVTMTKGKSAGKIANSGAPSCLISYGEENIDALADSGIKGKHILINAIPVICVGLSPSWKSVVSIALSKANGEASVKKIYELVELIAPDKVAKNSHFKEKIRQQLQYHFERINKGIYKN